MKVIAFTLILGLLAGGIIVVFSGSDWCAPCIKLDKSIWQSEAFKKESEKEWIIVKADFPRKKANVLTKEQTEQNKQNMLFRLYSF